MLSYRHSYHAGNHADVLKHTIQIQLLQYLTQKDKPFWVIDTHAGAGVYALDSVHAEKLGEYRDGIGRLWSRQDLPAPVAEYVDAVRSLNPDGSLRAYPGSPWISAQALREQDRMRLFELHSSDFRTLSQTFAGYGKQVIVQPDDGFAQLKALLPPPPRRALTLIDPSYELREDYDRLITTLREALQRFPTGVFAIWYPQLARAESRQLPNRLKALGANAWLHVALTVRTPGPIGMHGSGMFIINPPWTLADSLTRTLPWLREVLAEDDGAREILEHHTT